MSLPYSGTRSVDLQSILTRLKSAGAATPTWPDSWNVSIEGAESLIVLGYARWDPNEVQLLELLSGISNCSGMLFFDIDEFSRQEEIDSVFPGLAQILEVPVLAEFKNGSLIWKLEGQAALARGRSLLGGQAP